jgi:hypothetical protein
MKQCGEHWQAAKSAGTTNGATWSQFLAQCRTQLGTGAATAVPTPAPAQPQTSSLFPWQTPATPTTATGSGNQGAMKQCGAQWQAAKAAGTTERATWPQFLKACRAQLVSTTNAPPPGGFTPAPAPASAPSPPGSVASAHERSVPRFRQLARGHRSVRDAAHQFAFSVRNLEDLAAQAQGCRDRLVSTWPFAPPRNGWSRQIVFSNGSRARGSSGCRRFRVPAFSACSFGT